jgi:hypothetical protein
VLTRFELYNEKNERICICKFIENYNKSASINGYFSRPVFRNYHNEIFGTMKYLGRSRAKPCKNISIDSIMDKDVMVDDDNDQNRGKDMDIDKEWWQNERKKIKPLDTCYPESKEVDDSNNSNNYEEKSLEIANSTTTTIAMAMAIATRNNVNYQQRLCGDKIPIIIIIQFQKLMK